MHPEECLARTQWDTFWVPQQTVIVDRPEVLYLAYPEDEPYLNTVLRLDAPAARLPALIAEVAAAHAGVRSRWPVLDTPLRPALEQALSDAGYLPVNDHFAYTMAVDAAQQLPAGRLEAREVRSVSDLQDWLQVTDRAFGKAPLARTPARLAEDLAQTLGERARRFLVYDEAQTPISAGGISVFPALRFGLLWAGATVPEARGRGGYGAVLAARARWAAAQGAAWIGVYGRTHTSAPILEAKGFQRHGRYTQWELLPT